MSFYLLGSVIGDLFVKTFILRTIMADIRFKTLEDGRRTVELITGIYRSYRDKKPIKFPLVPENGTDYDGRLKN